MTKQEEARYAALNLFWAWFGSVAGMVAILVLLVVAGGSGVIAAHTYYLSKLTGPCAWHGGVSMSTQEDYGFCNDGEKVYYKEQNGENSWTVHGRVDLNVKQ